MRPNRRPRRSIGSIVGTARWAAVVAVLAACASVPASARAAPETTITAAPSTGANDASAQFSFESDAQNPTFECRLDSSAWSTCSTGQSYSSLSDGEHTFDVRARDGAGVYDPTPATSTWSVEPLTGMWYSTWYVNRGNYNWGQFGHAATKRFLADVNGDGRDDAVAFYNEADSTGHVGRWYVAISNGDGKADAILYVGIYGGWYVALSTGSSFAPYTEWTSGHGLGSTDQLLGDVTGDGRADAVVYFGSSGKWYVAPASATPTHFLGYTEWKSGFGTGTTTRFLADMTGDGAADAVTFNAQDGTWAVAKSCALPGSCSQAGSSSFSVSSNWTTAANPFGKNAVAGLVGDVTGDGKSDAVAYMGNGEWRRAPTTSVSGQDPWKTGHSGAGAGVVPMLGNVDGQMRDSTGTYPPTDDPIIYADNEGSNVLGRWKFLPAEGTVGNSEPLRDSNGAAIGPRDGVAVGET